MLDLDCCHVLRIETPLGANLVKLEEDYYTIGRGSKSSIVIHDKEISRCHATILKETENNTGINCYSIYDGDINGKRSTNGLIVNKEYCLKHLLKAKDYIMLGTNVVLTYHQLSSKAFQLLKSVKTTTKRHCAIEREETINFRKTIVFKS